MKNMEKAEVQRYRWKLESGRQDALRLLNRLASEMRALDVDSPQDTGDQSTGSHERDDGHEDHEGPLLRNVRVDGREGHPDVEEAEGRAIMRMATGAHRNVEDRPEDTHRLFVDVPDRLRCAALWSLSGGQDPSNLVRPVGAADCPRGIHDPNPCQDRVLTNA